MDDIWNQLKKPTAKLTKRKQERPKVVKLEMKEITIDYNNISRIIRACFQNLLSKQLDNVEKMDGFLDM